ncbi:hypothetical protein WOLCODRAFT_165532 [Wolfiporia cocos MD-104 SS10]|uniref:DUF6534 domain-containing protein n=1 Tax=Wolfiporia cocos (strain MD-104) TaxID=742152 RepID=A0A2H3K1C7_WOLCO|nr:hypothetical protein WOLCODRAFT_165532 [Wolfiporia cocos MD-104 SS10]
MGELDGTYGAVLIGVYISAILYGVTNVQVFFYFREYRSDVAWNKLSVAWLWLLDTLHLSCSFHAVYWYLITNFGNSARLSAVVWSFKAQLMIDAFVTVSCHTFYMIRVWKLNAIARRGHKVPMLPLIVSLALLSGYAAVIATGWAVVRTDTYNEYLEPTEKWVTYYPLSTAIVIDAVIAICLCRLLAQCRTGNQRTDSVLAWLMFYTVNTGILTGTVQLLAMIMFAVFPHRFIFIAIEFSVTKIYINSFMAMFNARRTLRMRTEASVLQRTNSLAWAFPDDSASTDEGTVMSSVVIYEPAAQPRCRGIEVNITVSEEEMKFPHGGVCTRTGAETFSTIT